MESTQLETNCTFVELDIDARRGLYNPQTVITTYICKMYNAQSINASEEDRKQI